MLPDDTPLSLRVLVSLHRGYGLGDAVQVSAILRHILKHRPHWVFDFQAEEGRHCVGYGIAHNTLAYGDRYPCEHYDAEVQLILYDTWSNWHDRPNTRVSSCLHERLGLGWDAECGRYQIHVGAAADIAAAKLIETLKPQYCEDRPVVAVHYEGDSSPTKKNLSHAQAMVICRAVEKLGGVPLLLDWRNRSPLPDAAGVATTGRNVFSREWGRDVEMNCAVIRRCAAFVGIDSGPSKCASATETPALVIWTGHHPAPFHDPAPNTTHLVPVGYHGLEPVCNDAGVIRWFEDNYRVRQYEKDPVEEIAKWLGETLR